MTGWKKLLLGFAVVGVLFLTLVILLVKVYVTPDRVHSLVKSGLEKSLHRKVSLGTVDIGFLSGIRLTKLSIRSKDEQDLLLSAENLELSYDLWRLLRGELYLGRILIKEPQLRLVREIDGRLNIDDLFSIQAAAVIPDDTGTVAPKPEPFGAIPLFIKALTLQGGTLQFIDRKLSQESPYRYRLEQLDVNIEKFSLTQPFPVTFVANLNDAPVSMELQFDIVNGFQSLQVHGSQLNLVPFLPYIQKFLPGPLEQGLLSAELQISKQSAGIAAKGQVVVDQLDIKLGAIHWKGVRVTLDQDLLYRPSDQVVEVKNIIVDIDGVQIGYQGKILLADPLQVAGEASVKVPDLREISALIPLEMREQAVAYALAGSLDATLNIEGRPVDLSVIQQATIKIIDLQSSIGGLRPALNGELSYSANRIRGDHLQVNLNGQVLAVTLDGSKTDSSLPYLTLMVSGEKLNLDALYPPKGGLSASVSEAKTVKDSAGKGAVAPGSVSRDKVSASAAQTEMFKLPFDGHGSLQLSQLSYQGLQFEKVQGQFTLHNGLLALRSLTAGLAGGSATLTGETDLSKGQIPIRGHIVMTGIDLFVLAETLLPEAQGSISGQLMVDSNFSGNVGIEDFLSALNAQGTFDLRDGEIKGSPLLAELSQFLVNPELKVLGFSKFSGNYGLKGRQGGIDAQLSSRQVSISPQGSFSLDGPLNMSLETRISPEFMAKSGAGAKGIPLLKDEKGWSLLPLKVKGDYSSPRLTLDSKGAKAQMKEGLMKELSRQLQKNIEGPTADQKTQQMQKLLEGTLKNLLSQ